MRITEKTKYVSFQSVEPYISEQSISDLKTASERALGSMYDLPFRVFYSCSRGDFSHLGNLTNPTVFQVYWTKRFVDFVNELAATLKALTLPQTIEEVSASSNLLKVDFAEGMLVFLQQYFGLKSFKEAEEITIGELIIAKRAQYNREKYQRELSKAYSKKHKHK